MRRTYFTYQEDEAYKEGFKDAERNKTSMEKNRMSDDDIDRAYFDGQKDSKREIERKRLDDEYWNECYNRENQLW